MERGYFRSRSEAMNEGIRMLIRRYKLAALESKLIEVKKGTDDLPSITDALIKTRKEEDG